MNILDRSGKGIAGLEQTIRPLIRNTPDSAVHHFGDLRAIPSTAKGGALHNKKMAVGDCTSVNRSDGI